MAATISLGLKLAAKNPTVIGKVTPKGVLQLVV